MIESDYFCMLSDEEKEQYKFGFCENCPFYECELVEEYAQFRESHAKIKKNASCSTDIIDADADISYDRSKLKDGCIMSCRHVCQIECDRKNVTDGIGDHYKIEITKKLKKDGLSWEKVIKEDTEERWEPSQPVFISAQTGQGKNYFIENTLIPYVRKLNCKEKTNYKILIFSNRLALKQQIKNRIDGNNNIDDKEEIYPYKEVADVMTYQSLLRRKQYLKENSNKYIFVICDEAHFFTSDAMFNPHTHKILETIVQVFHKSVRVYMSATPYECLDYIIKCEEEEQDRLNVKKYDGDQSKCKCAPMVFYHFKRDHSYLDVKTYSSIKELYDEIVESVAKRKEKWLIFIDDKNECGKVKDKLKDLIEDKKSKKKDEEDAETDKDNEDKKKVEKVYVVDADSKKKSIYQEIVKNEGLNKDTYVLISTSVLDNGVNLTGIKNIVVSDMEKSKCLQMVGRARKSTGDEHKTLYMKRFCADEVDKRIKNLMSQQDAYHGYELAYDEKGKARSSGVYQFFNKYYCGKEADWENAKHWFGISFDETQWYLNEIAKSLVERLIPQYEYIRDEMIEEELKEKEQQGQNVVIHVGQKYLEYQLSWFGKKYCEDDDITYVDKEKAKKEFLAFLESYAVSGKQIVETGKESPFREEFTRLFDTAFGRKEPNKKRIYSITKMNSLLEEKKVNFKVVSHSAYWVIEECNWEIESLE